MNEEQNKITETVEAAGEKKGSIDKEKIKVRNLDFYYGDAIALKKISMDIPSNQVTALIGPSGC